MAEALIIFSVLAVTMLLLHIIRATARMTEHDRIFEAQRVLLQALAERLSRVELELGKRR